NLVLKPQRLAEPYDRRFVALAEPLMSFRDANRSGVQADDARGEARMDRFADIENAGFLRAARPFMGTPAVEIGLDRTQIDVENSVRLSAIDEAHGASLVRESAQLARRKQIAYAAGHVGERHDLRSGRDRFAKRVDEDVGPGVRVDGIDYPNDEA